MAKHTEVINRTDNHGNGIFDMHVDGNPVVSIAAVYGINERFLGWGVFKLNPDGSFRGWTKGKYDFATALDRANAMLAKAGGNPVERK